MFAIRSKGLIFSSLTRKAISCPALQYLSLPVVRSRIPMNIVTNIPELLPLQNVSLMFCMMLAGLSSRDVAIRNNEWVIVITIAAGIPLPLTSPIQKNSFSSLRKKSNKSPPTSFAGVSEPKMSISLRSGYGGKVLGNISSCILRAILSSFSICCRSASACCSRMCPFIALQMIIPIISHAIIVIISIKRDMEYSFPYTSLSSQITAICQ